MSSKKVHRTLLKNQQKVVQKSTSERLAECETGLDNLIKLLEVQTSLIEFIGKDKFLPFHRARMAAAAAEQVLRDEEAAVAAGQIVPTDVFELDGIAAICESNADGTVLTNRVLVLGTGPTVGPLIGAKTGDIVEIEMPDGKHKISILKTYRQGVQVQASE